MELNEFFKYVFDGDQEGFFALSLFKGGKPVAEQFIEVPNGLRRVSDKKLMDLGLAGDVFYTPALFHVKKRRVEFCVGSWVSWVDLDVAPDAGETVTRPATLPAPGLVVASGSPGHEHVYRRSQSFLAADAGLAQTNRKLASLFGGDRSGHDVTQLLRVPGTFNHKHKPPRPVSIVDGNLAVFDLSAFREEEEAESVVPIQPVPITMERWDELSEYAKGLFNSTPLPGTRSDKLFELACRVLEEGFTESEARYVIDEAATKWRKFVDRSDRIEQLDTLLRRAVEKTTAPLHIVEDTDEQGINWKEAVGFKTLLTKSPRVEWIIPGVLYKQGLMYLVGPTGIGKTTLAFNLGLSIALSKKDWLGFEIEQRETPEKVFVASHEMNSAELVEFLLPMSSNMTADELDHLEEYFQVRATGQAVALDDKQNQRAYEDRLRKGNFTGFILDTLGASTKTSLQDEAGARAIADWADKLRQQLGIWVIIIAHPRKTPAGVKNYRFSIDDAYGSRIFGDRANSVFIMQRNGGIELDSVKTRFLGGTSSIFLKRNTDHWFEKTERTATNKQEPALKIEGDISMKDLEGERDFDV